MFGVSALLQAMKDVRKIAFVVLSEPARNAQLERRRVRHLAQVVKSLRQYVQPLFRTNAGEITDREWLVAALRSWSAVAVEV